MSSPERRKLKALAWEAEEHAMYVEQHRRASLTMWERIEEFVDDDELKTILHKIAEQCGLEN